MSARVSDEAMIPEFGRAEVERRVRTRYAVLIVPLRVASLDHAKLLHQT